MTMSGAAARKYVIENGKLPEDLRTVGGDLYLKDTSISSLGGLQSVGGNLDLRGASISSLGSLRSVGGDLYLRGASISSLGSLRSVGGDLYLQGTSISSLGALESVRGGIDLRGAPIADIGRLQSVGGSLYLDAGYPERGGQIPPDVPTIPDIHQAIYAAASAPGALDMSHWHAECGTTHCRAGWAVTLAGEAGAELERRWGTGTAAAFIYMASDPGLTQLPDWMASHDDALEDMARMAGVDRNGN